MRVCVRAWHKHGTLIKSETHSAWPLRHASCNAVMPECLGIAFQERGGMGGRERGGEGGRERASKRERDGPVVQEH